MATIFAVNRVIPGCSRNALGGVPDELDPRGGLNQKTIERLKERARHNGRTLQQEVKALLERAAETLTMREARRVSERWGRRLNGRSFSDSAQLIREDRDSR
jgi:hypothetical protein